MKKQPKPALRFWPSVDTTTGVEGCWLWVGPKTKDGYGYIGGKPNTFAHRLAYQLLVGPIPDGLTIDHLCRVRACVNPRHLEAVTMRENIMRGRGAPALNALNVVCIRGHAFDEANTRWLHGRWRVCKTCARQRDSGYPKRKAG